MNKEKHHHRGKSSESLFDKQTILRELNIQTGQTVLDAGCGNGYMAKEFAKITGESGKVYALDPDETSINILKSEVQNTVIEAFVGDITKVFKRKSLDIKKISGEIKGNPLILLNVSTYANYFYYSTYDENDNLTFIKKFVSSNTHNRISLISSNKQILVATMTLHLLIT